MLPGLPPRDKSFKGWLLPLVIPMAAFTLLLTIAGILSCFFGDQKVGGDHLTGIAGAFRVVLTAPIIFVVFLLLVTTICWVDSRLKSWRRRKITEPDGAGNSHRAGQ